MDRVCPVNLNGIMIEFLDSGADLSAYRLLLAHGAGAPMTSPFLEAMADYLAALDVAVSRFEFAYMAGRRTGGKKRPPPRADKLVDDYRAAVAVRHATLRPGQRLVIGGKSMGGRVASMIADDLYDAGTIAGLVCLGYPFHPTGKPDALRTAHLESLRCPALIVQGTRDPFGSRAEVEGLRLSASVRLHWIGDGDHDFGPRGASPYTRKGNLADAAAAVAAFLRAAEPQR